MKVKKNMPEMSKYLLLFLSQNWDIVILVGTYDLQQTFKV
jgi:hypothetical protein